MPCQKAGADGMSFQAALRLEFVEPEPVKSRSSGAKSAEVELVEVELAEVELAEVL